MKKCTKCKNEKDESGFGDNKSWCLECYNNYSIEYYYNNKNKCLEKSKIYFQTPLGKFSKYKTKANERGLAFLLSFENFISFWEKSCFYCGANIETIGLDRVENNLGYTSNNVVSCCTVCNILKNDLTISEWTNYLAQLKDFLNFNKNIEIKYSYKNKYNYKLNRQYSQYKYSAKRRGKEFNLSFSDFILFNNVPCHYCGTITNIICLDRINNEIGYNMNNVVSSCKICNNGKNTLSYEKWEKHLQNLSKFDLNLLICWKGI